MRRPGARTPIGASGNFPFLIVPSLFEIDLHWILQAKKQSNMLLVCCLSDVLALIFKLILQLNTAQAV